MPKLDIRKVIVIMILVFSIITITTADGVGFSHTMCGDDYSQDIQLKPIINDLNK